MSSRLEQSYKKVHQYYTRTHRRKDIRERDALKLDVEEARNSPVRYSKPHVLVPQNKVFAARALRRDAYTPVLDSANMFQR